MTTLASLRVLANGDPRVFAEAIKKFGLQIVGLRSKDPLESQVRTESVAAIASTLTEGIDDPVELPGITVQAMRIAEEHGYIVKILAEMDMPGEEMGGGAPAVAPPKRKMKPGRRQKPGPEERPPKRQPFNPPRPQVDPDPKACRG